MTEEKQETKKDFFDPEEEVTIDGPGKVDLPEVELKTGEEDEEVIYKQRVKMYRFRDDQWKERGLGDAKLLRHKETKKIRFVMKQEKTFKVRANFLVQEEPLCKLEPFQGSEKAFSFIAIDFSDESESKEVFVIKFGSKGTADAFKEALGKAQVFNAKVAKGETDLEMASVLEAKEETK